MTRDCDVKIFKKCQSSNSNIGLKRLVILCSNKTLDVGTASLTLRLLYKNMGTQKKEICQTAIETVRPSVSFGTTTPMLKCMIILWSVVREKN